MPPTLPLATAGSGEPGAAGPPLRSPPGRRIGQYEIILRGHAEWVQSAEFSPDDRRIVSASLDTTVRIWSADGPPRPADQTLRIWRDLAPLGLDDPRLWSATTYCMPIDRRIETLGVSEDQARRDRERCLERVARAAPPPP